MMTVQTPIRHFIYTKMLTVKPFVVLNVYKTLIIVLMKIDVSGTIIVKVNGMSVFVLRVLWSRWTDSANVPVMAYGIKMNKLVKKELYAILIMAGS